MLQKQSVGPELLELLTSLMNEEAFQNFVLVGGTSLALQLGHRLSVDIDLFGKSEIDENYFLSTLRKFGEVIVLKKSKNILICSVNGIKVDFVNYNYNWLDDYIEVDLIRLASKKDIGAMKLNAIAGRGSKKDFIDLFFLMEEFTIDELLAFYLQKFDDGSEFMVRKSLTYFDDADLEETPTLLNKISWDEIKGKILKKIV
jgi:hypothetical protein